MQEDFHYYATYCAAFLAGYSHEESLEICTSDVFVDFCSEAFLSTVRAPSFAATTQTQIELANVTTDPPGLANITRIWASFHFLPYDLFAKGDKLTKKYLNKYRLICNSNSDLLVETVELARGQSLPAAGIAMHVLADTWAHKYFAGTPSLVINNTDSEFYELTEGEGGFDSRRVRFRHNPAAGDDIEKGIFTNTLYQGNEQSVMNLGHGRAGHLPDYSYVRYRYLPAWGNYQAILKDNPSDYLKAFCQMVYALRFLKGQYEVFEKHRYDTETVKDLREEIWAILTKRQPDGSADWKALGERLSGEIIPEYDINEIKEDYLQTEPEMREESFLGKFISAASAQKSMVTRRIWESGNPLAGHFADASENRERQAIRDSRDMNEQTREKR